MACVTPGAEPLTRAPGAASLTLGRLNHSRAHAHAFAHTRADAHKAHRHGRTHGRARTDTALYLPPPHKYLQLLGHHCVRQSDSYVQGYSHVHSCACVCVCVCVPVCVCLCVCVRCKIQMSNTGALICTRICTNAFPPWHIEFTNSYNTSNHIEKYYITS
jgi:hypothetical protein